MNAEGYENIGEYADRGMTLRIECNVCGNDAMIPARDILSNCRKRRSSERMEHIALRLRCSECGSRNVNWAGI